jgi:adenosylcobinamide amidohydrolase
VSVPPPTLREHVEAGQRLPVLVWHPPRPVLTIASAPFGGGIGRCDWIINATVPSAYSRLDPAAHLAELAHGLDLGGPGVGLLTAVDVREAVTATDAGVVATVTVGLGHPTWAAAPDGDLRHHAPGPGTINIVGWLPVTLAPAALVNAVSTATEAKVQALIDYAVPATGTATDAVCLACPPPEDGLGGEAYGGPRSVWGGRLARAVYAAVVAGTHRWNGRPDAGARV